MNEIENFIIKPLLKDNKIHIPENINNVKFDIGLSHTAVNSILWLNNPHLNDRFVFGFEPNSFLDPYRSVPQHKDRFKLINCGLSNVECAQEQKMFINGEDPGQSSFYKPNWFVPITEVEFPVISFKTFLDFFPWDRFPFIEQVKTDTQGCDLDILKSMGDYITKVVYLEVESQTYDGEYEDTSSKKETQSYLEKMGFILTEETNEIDQTYVNSRYISVSKQLDNSRVQ